MADLYVQPKKRSPWWLWLLLIIIILGVVYYFVKGRNQLATMNTSSTDSTTQADTSKADNTIIKTDTAVRK